MNEDDSGSWRKLIEPQQSPSGSLLDEIDWEKVRAAAYKITAQVNAVKEVEQAVRKQLQGLCDTEWQGRRDWQEYALGITQTAAAEWLIANLDWHELQSYMFAVTERVGSTDEITQCVRDKLLKMSAEQWEKVEDRKKYLSSIVHNAATDWLKREESQQYAAAKRLRHTFLQEDDPCDLATLVCAQCDVVTLLKKLGPRVRQAFVFRQGWGYTVKEIAGQMSISEETVKSYLSKAAEVFSGLEECREARGRRGRLTRWLAHKDDQA